jgi:hypothetical protein
LKESKAAAEKARIARRLRAETGDEPEMDRATFAHGVLGARGESYL